MTVQPTTMPATAVPAKLTGKQILVNGLIAIVAATIANVIVRLLLGALVAIPGDFPPMQLGAIAFFTALYGAGATAVYWIINRVSSNPQRVWLVVVIIGFVLTALPDLALAANPSSAPFPGGTSQLWLLLLVFHLVAGIIYYLLIPRRR